MKKPKDPKNSKNQDQAQPDTEDTADEALISGSETDSEAAASEREASDVADTIMDVLSDSDKESKAAEIDPRESESAATDSVERSSADADAEYSEDADDSLHENASEDSLAETRSEDVEDEEPHLDPYATDPLGPEEPAPAYSALGDQPHEDEHAHRSLAATALMFLVGFIVIASLTLWAAPKVAPFLPAGVAQYLMPGQIETESRLAALEQAINDVSDKSDAAAGALKAEVAALSGRLDTATEAAQAQTAEIRDALATAQAAADSVASAAVSLADRLDKADGELASMREEFAAVSSALEEASTGIGTTDAEFSAKLAAIAARLDKLTTAIGDGTATQALEDKLANLAARLDAVESSAADARDVQKEALGEVSSALQQTRLQAAVDVLASRLTGGLSYAAKLNEIAEISGATPPDALSAKAESGVATAAALEATFSRQAQAAIAADVRARAGEGAGMQALGWLKSQIAGRPVAEQEGDDVGAITSRIAARVEDGDLAAALTEAETLPEPAKAGLGRWLDQLRARVAAEAALDDWRGKLGAGG